MAETFRRRLARWVAGIPPERDLAAELGPRPAGGSVPKMGPIRRRNWAGAQWGRLYGDWVAPSLDPISETAGALTVLRDRARDLEKNSALVRRYLGLVGQNVVGEGVRFQATNFVANGTPNMLVNGEIEAAWLDWCQVGHCTRDGRDAFPRWLRLLMRHYKRDGEVFVVLMPGAGPWGLQVHMLPSELVDEFYSGGRLGTAGGRDVVIRQGIEIDAYGKPLAYYLRPSAVPDFGGIWIGPPERVPAENILHLFDRRRVGQLRGESRLAPVMAEVRQMDGFSEAALIAARMGAAKMGFKKKTGDAPIMDDADLEDSSQNPQASSEVAPGVIETLDYGEDFVGFDPNYPNGEFEPFINAFAHRMAAGLDVSHSALTGNLSEVNYGSLRGGELAARESWKIDQQDLIDHVLEPIFNAWFPLAALKIKGLRADLQSYRSHRWQPRRWPWIDPLKDLEASALALKIKITSRTRIAADQGADLEEVFADIQAEQQLADAYEIVFEPLAAPTLQKDLTDATDANGNPIPAAGAPAAGKNGKARSHDAPRRNAAGGRVGHSGVVLIRDPG